MYSITIKVYASVSITSRHSMMWGCFRPCIMSISVLMLTFGPSSLHCFFEIILMATNWSGLSKWWPSLILPKAPSPMTLPRAYSPTVFWFCLASGRLSGVSASVLGVSDSTRSYSEDMELEDSWKPSLGGSWSGSDGCFTCSFVPFDVLSIFPVSLSGSLFKCELSI